MTKTICRPSTLLGRSALGVLALAIATPALAQDEAPAAETQAAEQDIVVTGSRIRGIDPVGSAVIAIDADQIMEEPVTSTNDILRRVPQVVSLGANRAGGTAQNGAANATRGAGINLRGLSTNATLLLYDGKRLPPQGTQGQFTDPSAIPSIALGRIEVVADGTSAVYGSDAVAGVVNLILRKDFSGIEVRGRYGITEADYYEAQAALLVGHKWDTGWIMAAGEYAKNNNLFGSELDFYTSDNRSRGGRDLRGTNCAPGTIVAGGVNYAIPAGGVTTANVGSLVAGTRNLCEFRDIAQVIPDQERWSGVAALSQDITDGVRIFADGFYSRRSGTLLFNPTANANVPSTNPFFVSPVPGATSVTVQTNFLAATGPLPNPYWASTWNVSGGLEADLFGDFQGTIYYAQGRSEEVADRRRSGINAGALNAALADTNPATALNVFGGPNNPATLARITDNYFVIEGRTRLEVINAQLDGSLFAIPGGNVRIAMGAEHRVEYTYTSLLTGQAATQVRTADSGTRNVDAVFAELFVPIVGADNAAPGLERLNLSLALRHENYSDFGSTTNPKIGVTYSPWQGLVLKGTYGTSFRAPTFTEVSTIGGGAGLYFDTLPGPSGNQIGIGIAGGNPGLQPEQATTWSFGVDVAPVALPGFTASVNYFRIDYTDQIQALRGTPGLLTNPIYSQFVQFNPTPAQISALVNSGLPINQAINQSLVTFIADGRRQNLGTSLFRGLDFTAAYRWNWGGVDLDAGIQGTYVLDYLFEAVPGAGLVDVLDTIGFTQRFRTQADIGAKVGGFKSRLTWNHLNGYTNTTSTVVRKVSNYDTFDLLIGYDFTDRINLSLDVRNLFDEDPPFVDTTNGFDPQASNPIPRMFAITANVKF
ncbi:MULTISPECIES: TonB-dependent siderophore receptor [unclassified Sphingomonas]|uniref:TonB-dependent receptor plug domain-containing protein n=1 Tax=unclassified Sphingomonas TaxID=196159 RepID=UPI0021519F92|nr:MULTISPECIES: TonB-dependent receptor [unclassified Sphingomonas]MCR5872484.1 TonB-dependent receptor [Sphingomonas sp. J344]UUX99233.1 TonB-dependent receptor [Sphingomonas sp. J315]